MVVANEVDKLDIFLWSSGVSLTVSRSMLTGAGGATSAAAAAASEIIVQDFVRSLNQRRSGLGARWVYASARCSVARACVRKHQHENSAAPRAFFVVFPCCRCDRVSDYITRISKLTV